MKDTKKKSKVTKILTTASLNDLVQIQKWWEKPPEEDNDKSDDEEETKKWKHMEHNGVLFAAEYEPHHIKIKYKGEPIELTPEQEEVATFWGTVVGSDFEKRVIAQQNFIKEFRKVLPEKYKDAKLSDFDFTPIREYLDKKKKYRKVKLQKKRKRIKKKDKN